jgi:hypothetical protein
MKNMTAAGKMTADGVSVRAEERGKVLRNSRRQEIRQDGLTVLWSNDGVSMSIVFGNLTGKNIADPDEYREYVQSRMKFSALKYGKIELVADGTTVAAGTIRETL